MDQKTSYLQMSLSQYRAISENAYSFILSEESGEHTYEQIAELQAISFIIKRNNATTEQDAQLAIYDTVKAMLEFIEMSELFRKSRYRLCIDNVNGVPSGYISIADTIKIPCSPSDIIALSFANKSNLVYVDKTLVTKVDTNIITDYLVLLDKDLKKAVMEERYEDAILIKKEMAKVKKSAIAKSSQ